MNGYNQVPHLTQDTTWGSDKNTRKHHIQESQDASPFQAGDHEAAINRQEVWQTRNINSKKESTKEAPLWNGQYFSIYQTRANEQTEHKSHII